jgi:hypothetical protein
LVEDSDHVTRVEFGRTDENLSQMRKQAGPYLRGAHGELRLTTGDGKASLELQQELHMNVPTYSGSGSVYLQQKYAGDQMKIE